MVKRIILTLLIIIFSQGVGVAQIADENFDDYEIKKEDELMIEVWQHPDLTQKVQVDLEGQITFPLIGKIRAAGLTVIQLTDKITYLLAKDYIVKPLVKIRVEKYIEKETFFVYGEVKQPGAHTLAGKMTLLRAITLAGGLTDFASPKVYIKRKVGNREEKIFVNINRIVTQELEDIPLLPDDIIIVRRRFF